jgi:hypothetical protein
MSAILFVLARCIVNWLKELVRKPGKLVLYLLVVVAILAIIGVSFLTRMGVETPAPLFFLTGVIFLFIALIMGISVVSGLSGGDAIFDMSDVNLLFVSPVSPRQVLLYGIVRMARGALLASFFILFQASTFMLFGIEYGGVLVAFACAFVAVLVMTTASLLIYSIAHGNARRKRVVKLLVVLLFVPLVVFFALELLRAQDMLLAVYAAVSSPFFQFVPVAGWTATAATALISGDVAAGLGFLGLDIALCGMLLGYLLVSNPDYYEDVLVATETAFEKKRALSEGSLDPAAASHKPVRLARTGIKGQGAAALFGKHMRESFRQSRLGFMRLSSLILVAAAIVASLFLRDLSITLQILMWSQIFLIGTGRGLRETYMHYLYLIPESSFKKILWSNMEICARTLVESVLVFGVAGLLVQAPVWYAVACALVYVMFSLLLLGINYLSMRFMGANLSMGVLIFIYYVAVVIVMLPGVALAVTVGVLVGGGIGSLVGLLVLAVWELALGLGSLALSRGVLHNCDMAMMKGSK